MSDFVDYQSRKFDPNINDPVLLWNIFVLCYFEYLEINVHAFSALLSSVRFSFCPGPRELWPFYPCPNVVVLLQIVRLPFLLIWSNFLSFSRMRLMNLMSNQKWWLWVLVRLSKGFGLMRRYENGGLGMHGAPGNLL